MKEATESINTTCDGFGIVVGQNTMEIENTIRESGQEEEQMFFPEVRTPTPNVPAPNSLLSSKNSEGVDEDDESDKEEMEKVTSIAAMSVAENSGNHWYKLSGMLHLTESNFRPEVLFTSSLLQNSLSQIQKN